MRTTDYLSAVKSHLQMKNNTELAKTLETSDAAISRYFSQDRVIDDYTAARVAELLGIDEMIVIAQANAEREKDERKRAFWMQKAADFTEKSTASIWRARRDSNARPFGV